ncbi:unnamed protein product [Tilletia controversa]|nr:unnamed protein product [Tilletia controversa]
MATKLSDDKTRRIDAVLDAMSDNELQLLNFLTEMLLSRSDAANRRVGLWITGTSGSATSTYGPAELVRSLIQYVNSAQAQFNDVIMTYAASVMMNELRNCRRDSFLHTSSATLDSVASGQGQWLALLDHYQERYPTTSTFLRHLIPTSPINHTTTFNGHVDGSGTASDGDAGESEDEHEEEEAHADGEGLEDEEEENDEEEGEGPDQDEDVMDVDDSDHSDLRPMSKAERTMTVVISVLLFSQSRQCNRFQCLNAVFCELSNTSSLIFNFLNRLGVTASQRYAYRAVTSMSTRMVEQAASSARNHDRIPIFVLDNINIYVRPAEQRVQQSPTMHSFTMRTMLELGSEFKPADLTIEDCEALRSADKTALQVKDLEPNESFLHDAALIHISEVLFRHMKLSRRRRKQILSEVHRMRQNHDIDVLTTTQTEIHPLKLVQEDEGNLSGMQQVLHQTMRDVGWNVGDKALPVVGDLLTVNNILSVVAVSEDEPEPINQLKFLAPWAAPWHMLLAWTRLLFRQNYLSGKAGSDFSLDRVREMLNRGKTGLNEKEPQFNEGWALLRHTFEGRLLAAMK